MPLMPFFQYWIFFFPGAFVSVNPFLDDFLSTNLYADFVFPVFLSIHNRTFFFGDSFTITCNAVVKGSSYFAKLVAVFWQAEGKAVYVVFKFFLFPAVFKYNVFVFGKFCLSDIVENCFCPLVNSLVAIISWLYGVPELPLKKEPIVVLFANVLINPIYLPFTS